MAKPVRNFLVNWYDKEQGIVLVYALISMPELAQLVYPVEGAKVNHELSNDKRLMVEISPLYDYEEVKKEIETVLEREVPDIPEEE